MRPGIGLAQRRQPSSEKNGAACAAPLVKQFHLILVYLPVPVRLEVCGLLLAESVTCKVPIAVPVAVGVNTTSIVHVALEVNCVPHVVEETLNSPVVVITMFLRIVLWWLSSLNAFAALVVPTFVFANVAVAGVNTTGASPVPLKATVCGLFDALS